MEVESNLNPSVVYQTTLFIMIIFSQNIIVIEYFILKQAAGF